VRIEGTGKLRQEEPQITQKKEARRSLLSENDLDQASYLQ